MTDAPDPSPPPDAHLRAALGALGDPRGADELDDAAMLTRVLDAAKNDLPLRSRRRTPARRAASFAIAAALLAATFVIAFAGERLGLWGGAEKRGSGVPSSQVVMGGAEASARVAGAPGASDAPPAAAASDLTPAPSATAEIAASSAAPAPQPPSADELLRRAQALLAAGDTSGAAAAYRNLLARYPHSAEAQAATMSLGQLALRGGDPAQALASFERYLAGGGPLAIEARAGRIQALRALGRTDAERAAIAEFLSLHPSSVHAARLRARLEEIRAP